VLYKRQKMKPSEDDVNIIQEEYLPDDTYQKMEDIRISGSAYKQVRIGEFISIVFTLCGVLSAIMASEVKFMLGEEKIASEINALNSINMSATALLGVSIVANAKLELQWKQHKHIYNNYDTLWNTDIWKGLVIEIAIIFVQPYPFFNKLKYREYNNNVSAEYVNAEYEINDILLCCMILLRSYFITRSLMKLTPYTEPRAQRVW